VAPESGSCRFPLPGLVGCGGITRNITLPPNSSENSVGFLSNLRRIPSAERSRGAKTKLETGAPIPSRPFTPSLPDLRSSSNL
jgi:hypothetical protein